MFVLIVVHAGVTTNGAMFEVPDVGKIRQRNITAMLLDAEPPSHVPFSIGGRVAESVPCDNRLFNGLFVSIRDKFERCWRIPLCRIVAALLAVLLYSVALWAWWML